MRWSRLSLSAKVSFVILLIVGISAGLAEYVDRLYVWKYNQETFKNDMLAVVRQIGGGITTLTEFYDRPTQELELYKLRASRPDLIDVAIYAAPTGNGGEPILLVSSGNTVLSPLDRPPPLLKQAMETETSVSDLSGWEREHLLKVAAPITAGGKVIGGSYAEFSTAHVDEVLAYQRRLSLTRRLIEGAVIVLAINFFLSLKVHQPVRGLLRGVEAVTHGNMTASVPVESEDEIGQLAARFNMMVERIRAATEENRRLYEELQKAHDDLQVRVEEATAELWQKNRELARTIKLLSTAQREAARAQRLSAIGQLAASVAHKIGTPLTALSGHIQLLAEDPNLGADARRRLRTVENQIERTSRIIQDLLIYARKPELALAPTDVNACLEECLTLLRPEMDRRNVVLLTDLAADLEKVQADQQQLQEAFWNLIENGMDAMPEGGTLTVRSYASDPSVRDPNRKYVHVEIADTGQGIPEELREQIFQPFFTTKKPGRGTGLGLAIAMETVRAHGGQISVESEPGKGARFTIALPTPREPA
jgi:two-component system NtrC family sensor kinase